MRAFLGFAAIAATALASAANSQTATFTHMHADPLVASLPHEGHHGGIRHGGGNDVHIHRGFETAANYAGYGYAYPDYSDFDGNRSFDPNKWNDWWHDRPDRAYPRWMSRNRDCARPWYSGDVLTC